MKDETFYKWDKKLRFAARFVTIVACAMCSVLLIVIGLKGLIL